MENSNIPTNITNITRSFVNPDCRLVAVSKTKPISAIKEAYEAGIRDFGENKVQELTEKEEQLPEDIRWHMIGHLQRNKVKYIAPFVHLIHSVDSLRLLKQINKEGQKLDRVIPCLLQVHIASEESKYGWDEEELTTFLNGDEIKEMQHIRILGLMGMATYTDDTVKIRSEFRGLKTLFERLKGLDLPDQVQMSELSMGMSGDYRIAQEEGSTMVRIGSGVFGERNYE
ncbi:YggS family pyridoxal phosphate-dependent enzyme [Cyclobacterium jeungdonense]|uniref:Pyridoxal phosphate homeostasis protein n=1 Tax=Cyclobacterium jeungdonense TaxID=708087 RepID=A0ABT8C1U9_9BACT|nr:YggS family pyridoxal phosphate-dependent enzyme [Cyclobacterium jeungdonense]MDN3686768.1 YggS family pyridoxal phosphate-dependent enzyme [Cyclobacterium jeungdonense]